MNTHIALVIAGIMFTIVSLMHLLRLMLKSEITISRKIVPMWASVLGFIVPLCLAIWMFMASGS